jgi:hypothetical protein
MFAGRARARDYRCHDNSGVLDCIPLTGEAMAVRLGNALFWLFIIIAGAWLWFAHSMGVDRDSPAVVYGGAGIALALGWALRYITRGRRAD